MTSEAKQRRKTASQLGVVADYASVHFDPGMAVEGFGLLANADQELRWFPSSS